MSRFQIVAISALCLIAGATPRAVQPVQSPKLESRQERARTKGDSSSAATPAVAPISLSDSDGQELILEELSARTAIQGMLSLTELELRFRNPKPRRIEGRFSCTLPATATISRFAKEVNGQLMEGEVVERLRANQVYEQFLHQMRDPALLEQDQGNRFSARIFPIEANASTRLILSYSTVLPMEDGVRRYALPLRGMPAIKHFTFRAFVSALPGEEGPGAAKSDLGGLSSATHSTADVLSVDESDYTPAHDIELTWHPTAAASRMRILKAGEFYVAALRPDVAPPAARAARQSWTFYIDTSASSAEGAEHRIHALETLLASLLPDDPVQLLAFDQEVVTLGSGRAADLGHTAGSLLHTRLFLGGTDLQMLFAHVAKSAKQDPDRTIVVASDLVATLGDVDRHALTEAMGAIPPHAAVHVLILGSRQDTPTAKALTAGRGRVVTIPFTESLDDRAHAAADALRRPLGASFDIADGAAQWVYPSHVDDVQSGSEIIVFGRMKPAADPAPRFNGPVATDVASPQSLPAATFGPLLEREAYRAYLDYLGEREANEPSEAVRSALATEQVKVSVERRVVIPRTTMLVLESEWDYQRFGLERRALASILTIDAGGIGVMDRHSGSLPQPIPLPVPRPIPVTKAATPPPPTSAPREGFVAGGVVGGVTGGAPAAVASGTVANRAEDASDHVAMAEREIVPESGKVAETVTVTSAAPLADADERSKRDAPSMQQPTGVPPPAAPRPIPVPSVSAQAPASVSEAITVQPRNPRRTRRESEASKKEIEWTAAERLTGQEIEELQAKLAADPRDRETYNRLSDALVMRADWNALRLMALQWQPYDPENPQVYEILGIADEHLGNTAEAARANASLIEVAPAKPELLQRAGLLLLRTHHAALAEAPLRRALELRPDRVNSYRHLALMLWLDGRIEEAAQVLESATRQQFPQWYGDAQRVIREELGYVYRAWGASNPARRAEIEQRARDYHVDLDRRDALRVTLAWETDANDVDLHVVDPDGEECYYSHTKTASGLELYQDITQGLGPEVIRTETLKKGTYHIGVNYFAAGPMGVSRGIVVVMRGADVEIYPFRLVEGGSREMRYITAVRVK